MDGFPVVTLEDAAPNVDIVITAIGNRDVVTLEHMRAMKDMTIRRKLPAFVAIPLVAARRLTMTPSSTKSCRSETSPADIVATRAASNAK